MENTTDNLEEKRKFSLRHNRESSKTTANHFKDLKISQVDSSFEVNTGDIFLRQFPGIQ